MIQLITDLNTIESASGLNVMEDLVAPSVSMDSPLTAVPVLLKKNGKEFLICRSVQKASIEQKKIRGMELIWYRPYVIFDDQKRITNVDRDLPSAIKRIVEDETVYFYGDMAFGIYMSLNGQVNLQMIDPQDHQMLTVYRIPKEKGVDKGQLYIRDWKQLAKKALVLFDGERQQKLRPFLDEPCPTNFKSLDALMRQAGIDIVCADTPIDLQDLIGLPLRKIPQRLIAFYRLEDEFVSMISPERWDLPHFHEVATLKPGEIILEKLYGKGKFQVGVGVNLSVSMAQRIHGDLMNLKVATPIFRSWRENKSLEDLPYYLIGAQATTEAVEGALYFAERKILDQDTFREIEIFDHYLKLLNEFRNQRGLNVYFDKYFANLHPTSRTLYPSVPSHFPVDPETHCIRFDTGILVFDETGFLRAATDIGRGITMKDPGKTLYEILRHTISDLIIPALNPGKKGKDIYHEIIDELEKYEIDIKKMGLMHGYSSLKEIYRRDVGHLMGREEPTSLAFTENQDHVLKEGMVGAIEFPWLFGEYALGYEDMFFVTPEGGVNISRK